jgi:hypothetical protein
VATVPLLFSLCAEAQAAAASSALAAASAEEQSRPPELELRVALETVQEYLWRLLIDWPRAMDREPMLNALGAARQEIAAAMRRSEDAASGPRTRHVHELVANLSAIAAQAIYGMPPAEWLALDKRALLQWTERAETLPALLLGELLREMPRAACSNVALMPPASATALLEVLAPAMAREPGFARAPTWGGVPVETGALARMRRHPLIDALVESCGNSVPARMAARLVELAALLEELGDAAPAHSRILALALAPGEGLAAVQSARGLLLHRVRIADGRVADYQIVAPTEWNFHPEGALVRGLEGLVVQQAGALERQAGLAVQALDPCVACRIEVGHA